MIGNWTAVNGDCVDMSCETWMEAISARIDGEPMPIEPRLVDAHLASCATCRAFAADAHVLGRAAGIAEATPVPDLAGHIVRAARAADRGSVWWVLRLGLGVVAVQVLIFSLPALLLGHADGADAHTARHLGSFAVAYAIGLGVVALRPAKARGMLPLTAALAACLAVTAVLDIIDGETPIFGEVRHVPEVVGLVLVWLLATPKRISSGGSAGRGARVPTLAVVDDGEATSTRRSS